MGLSPHNRDVAEAFSTMADLLQIQGGDTHRIRAFRRTARAVETLGEPVARLLERNALSRVPGLGEGSVHRIKQILRTGSFEDLDRLRASLPGGLRDMLELEGVGPRTVRTIHQHLRIGSVDELEWAARSGRLAALPRMGGETTERILRSIALWRTRIGRIPLYRAMRTGNRFLVALRALPDVTQAEFGGSIRRGKATIGDIDLVVASDQPALAVARLCSVPGVVEILWRGEDRCGVRLETREQVDLWVVPTDRFGAGQHAWSGSQLHVVAIRARGHKLGLKITEDGVFRRSDETLVVPGAREADIFAAVGLPYIPPEIRENTGEIEAAEAGRLPRLIEARDLRGDLHMHTLESDGAASASDMAHAALALGHEYIAITEHSKSLTIANGLDEGRVLEQCKSLRRLEGQLGQIRLLAGIEVDILADGALDLDPSVLRQLDWVVASVHSDFDMPEHAMTERMVRAIESGLVDCIGHPTGRMLGSRDGYRFDMEKVLQTALRHGVAMEVNGSPKRMDLDDTGARACREMGVPVCIDTDAHAPEQLSHREFGLAAARRGWIEPKDVVNTWPAATLSERRRDRARSHGIVVQAGAPRPTVAGANLQEIVLDPTNLDDAMVARLERYLAEGSDDALESALRKLSDNPLSKAFELLFSARR